MAQPSSEQIISDGRAAERLLSDPIFQKHVLEVEEQIKDTWANASTLREREDAHAEIQGLKRVLVRLRAAADAAEVELMVREGETMRFGAQ